MNKRKVSHEVFPLLVCGWWCDTDSSFEPGLHHDRLSIAGAIQ